MIAIDTDPASGSSTSPLGEDAAAAIDGLAATKYLNLAQPPLGIGIVVSPLFGNTTVQSIQFTTANDAENRDPAGWTLYGTNDVVTSVDNGELAGSEVWTEIAGGVLSFPADRETVTTPINFANSTSFNNYRIEFSGPKGGPGDRDALNGIQVGDIQLFEQIDGGGTGVFGFGDTAIGYHLPQPQSFYFPGEEPGNVVDYARLPDSSYPGGENPGNLIDGDTGTKYLNFGGGNSGFIATLDTPAQIESFVLTSANDALGRHPTSYQLFGTNDLIQSQDNSFGTDETWTEISSGVITPPTELFTDSPVVAVANSTSYSSYKLLFPETNGDTIMQISEASFFTSSDGTGQDVLELGSPTLLAIDEDVGGTTKHFNAGLENVGFIITPSTGPSIIDGLQITTADDANHRDPASWVLYGTNDTIVSEDNSQGDGETWVEIASGDFTADEVPEDRNATGDIVAITNSAEYESYRIVFPTIRDASQENGFQIADIQLFGEALSTGGDPGDYNGDGLVDASDYVLWRDGVGGPTSSYEEWSESFGAVYSSVSPAVSVPEPSAAGLLAITLLISTARKNRRQD